MPTPYNQLQNLRFNYSGREIGINSYKPYTFANERASVETVLSSTLIGAIKESGTVQTSISSGSFVSSIKDSGSLQYVYTGSFVYSPGDIKTSQIVISGNISSSVKDNQTISTVVGSGFFQSPVNDTSDIEINFYSNFTGENLVEAETESTISGVFKYQRSDDEQIDFNFITGSYFEGHYSANHPISGEDIKDIDFIFFTGTYQG